MNRFKYITVCFPIVFLLSCSYDPTMESNLNRLVVWCTLNPSFRHQTVVVEMGRNIVDIEAGTREFDIGDPVTGALVTITGDGQKITFQEVETGKYQDMDTPLMVNPGEPYRLRVESPNGQVAEASTTVPGAFSILSPVNSDTITAGRNHIEWQHSEGAAGYQVRRVPLPCVARSDWGALAARPAGETSADFTLIFWEPCYDSTTQVTQFIVMAHDSARWDSPTSNIMNGAGEFSAIIADTVSVFVLPEPPDTQ